MSRDERVYIAVHNGLTEHPKIDALSDKAFRCMVDLWCWCSRNLTDGEVPEATWRKRVPGKARVELVTAGLVEVKTGGGVVMHDYLRHQRSREQVDTIRTARRGSGGKGNHQRWHVDRGIVEPTCPICVPGGVPTDEEFPPEPFPDESQEPSQTRSENDRETSPETETDTPPSLALGRGTPRDRPAIDRPAARCAAHLDAIDPPACWACRDARRAQEAWDRAEADRRNAAPEYPPGPCPRHPDQPNGRCVRCAAEAAPPPADLRSHVRSAS